MTEIDSISDYEKVPEQIIDGVVDENLSSLGADIAEVGLDTLLKNGFLKDLPVVGIIFKSLHAAKNIHDRMFIAKVARFMLSLKDVSEKDRERFKERLMQDPKFKKKVGETLCLVLERLDDVDKPEILARVFKAYLADKIGFSDFRRLASAIDIAFIDDLREFAEIQVKHTGHKRHYDFEDNLVRAGLFKIVVDVETEFPEPTTRIGGGGRTIEGTSRTDISFEITDLGWLFFFVMKDKWPDKKTGKTVEYHNASISFVPRSRD